MPTIKIYPPTQLSERDVTETQFNIWQEELEIYLMQEKDFAVFIQGGAYSNWESQETNKDRIPALKAQHIVAADDTVPRTEDEANEANEAYLDKVRKNLRTAQVNNVIT